MHPITLIAIMNTALIALCPLPDWLLSTHDVLGHAARAWYAAYLLDDFDIVTTERQCGLLLGQKAGSLWKHKCAINLAPADLRPWSDDERHDEHVLQRTERTSRHPGMEYEPDVLAVTTPGCCLGSLRPSERESLHQRLQSSERGGGVEHHRSPWEVEIPLPLRALNPCSKGVVDGADMDET